MPSTDNEPLLTAQDQELIRQMRIGGANLLSKKARSDRGEYNCKDNEIPNAYLAAKKHLPKKKKQQQQHASSSKKYSEYEELYRYCSISEENRMSVEGAMKSWNFDQEQFSCPDLAILSAVTLIKKRVDRYLGVSAMRIGQLCVQIERSYHDVPYHNFRHGFMVLHMTGRLISRMDLMNQGRKQLNELHRVGLLLAALCHDMFHEGPNQYHVMTQSVMALTYTGDSALDQMHCGQILQTLKGFQFFDGMDYGKVRELKAVIQNLILSTDITDHENLLNECKSLELPRERRGSANQQLLYCRILIHSADIATPTLEPNLAKVWSRRMLEEFTVSIEDERQQGVIRVNDIVAPVGSPEEAKLHLDFIDMFVLPAWRMLNQLMPTGAIKTYVAAIDRNMEVWQKQLSNNVGNNQLSV